MAPQWNGNVEPITRLVRSGKRSRNKGAGGERELCALLAAEFGIPVRRKLGQARDSGHDIDLPGFNVEVKRRARIAGLYEWLEQADSVTRRPVLMLRGDGKDWLCVMRLPDWCALAREEINAPPEAA